MSSLTKLVLPGENQTLSRLILPGEKIDHDVRNTRPLINKPQQTKREINNKSLPESPSQVNQNAHITPEAIAAETQITTINNIVDSVTPDMELSDEDIPVPIHMYETLNKLKSEMVSSEGVLNDLSQSVSDLDLIITEMNDNIQSSTGVAKVEENNI